jgi:two-component system response regulator RegA
MTGPILVVDDDRDVLHAARLALADVAERVDTAQTTAELAGRVTAGAYEAVLLDMNFAIGDHSGREGLTELDRLRAADPHLSIVPMTTFGGVALAIEALKGGATDFVLKPWRNDKLAEAVRKACERTREARHAASTFGLDAAERAEIQRALEHHGRNISRTAAALGLTRPALYRRMAKHGL